MNPWPLKTRPSASNMYPSAHQLYSTRGKPAKYSSNLESKASSRVATPEFGSSAFQGSLHALPMQVFRTNTSESRRSSSFVIGTVQEPTVIAMLLEYVGEVPLVVLEDEEVYILFIWYGSACIAMLGWYPCTTREAKIPSCHIIGDRRYTKQHSRNHSLQRQFGALYTYC